MHEQVLVYVYFKNGNVDVYPVESVWKAREHAEKIFNAGYRMQVGDRMEWFGPHYIDKICWDCVGVPGAIEDYLRAKYEGSGLRSRKEKGK
jgi:hypothetical protein